MGDAQWIGLDSDWNDPNSWSNGVVPSNTDTALFEEKVATTVEGAAYIGQADLVDTELTISGQFAGDGVVPAAMSDQNSTATGNVLTVDPWGSLNLSSLDLGYYTLDDQGILVTQDAGIVDASVTGPSASWFSTSAVVAGTLSALLGGQLEGNFTLANNAVVESDQASELSNGTLSVEQTGTIHFLDSSGATETAASHMVSETIALATGSMLSVVSDDTMPVVFAGSIGGSGTLSLENASLEFAAPAASQTASTFSVSDQVATASNLDVTVDAGTSLKLGTLSLLAATLLDNGSLTTSNADIAYGDVAGPGAVWISASSTITGSLSVDQGGALLGDFFMAGGAIISVDTTSSISGGTLYATGDNTIAVSDRTGGTQPTPYVIADDVNIASGATLSILSSGTNAVQIDGAVTGAGTLSLSGAYLTVSQPATAGGLGTGQHGGQAPLPVYNAVNSDLNLLPQATGQATLDTIDCSGGTDTVTGGAVDFTVTTSGATAIHVQGGSGANTVSAGMAALTYLQGDGAAQVFCGNSGEDRVTVGAAPSTVWATKGSKVNVIGQSQTDIYDSGGAMLVDATKAGGNLAVYEDSAGPASSIYGGAGNLTVNGGAGAVFVQGGTGNTVFWANSSEHDTLIGGTGANTLVGATGASITGLGMSNSLYGDMGSAATIDASKSTGNDTIFAGVGPGVTRLIGGSGTNVFLGGMATCYVQCGDGVNFVWANAAADDTISGGLGRDLIESGVAATVNLAGSQPDIVVSSGDGTVVNAQGATGSTLLFAEGSGATTLLGGSGSLVALVVGTEFHANTSETSNLIWTLARSDVTLTGEGPTTVVATGSAISLDASAATGANTIFLANVDSATVKLGSGVSNVLAGAGSADILVSSGQSVIYGGSGSLAIDVDPQAGSTGNLVIANFGAQDTLQFQGDPAVSTLQTSYGTEFTSTSVTVLLYGYFGSVSVGH